MHQKPLSALFTNFLSEKIHVGTTLLALNLHQDIRLHPSWTLYWACLIQWK